MNITIALGGGGSKGNAHIGVLRGLEKRGFKIKAVAGTSFGGVVAVFYALGYTPDEIEATFSALDQAQLYGFAPDEGPSLLGLAGVTRWLREIIGDKTFTDLKIPCAVTATDLHSGREVVLSEGSLVESILATTALPGIFPARKIGEWELVDGGALNPVPVLPARQLKPGLPVIAVVLAASLGIPAQTWNLPLAHYLPRPLVERIGRLRYAQALDVFTRSLDIVMRAITEYRLQVDKPDIILRPRVLDIDILEKVDVHQVAVRGDEIVQENLDELKRLFSWGSRFRRALGA
jgi:NTE family protein